MFNIDTKLRKIFSSNSVTATTFGTPSASNSLPGKFPSPKGIPKKADGKAVYFYNKKHPSLKIVDKVYKKINDDKKIPIVFQTRKQYINEYIKNQEIKKRQTFTPEEKNRFKQEEYDNIKNVQSRFTTFHNEFMPPRTVFFTDSRLTPRTFQRAAFHEYAHEAGEKHPQVLKKWKNKIQTKTAPTWYGKTDKEEDFAESYALYRQKELKDKARRDFISRNDRTLESKKTPLKIQKIIFKNQPMQKDSVSKNYASGIHYQPDPFPQQWNLGNTVMTPYFWQKDPRYNKSGMYTADKTSHNMAQYTTERFYPKIGRKVETKGTTTVIEPQLNRVTIHEKPMYESGKMGDIFKESKHVQIINPLRNTVVRDIKQVGGVARINPMEGPSIEVPLETDILYEPWFEDRGSLVFHAPTNAPPGIKGQMLKLATEGDIVETEPKTDTKSKNSIIYVPMQQALKARSRGNIFGDMSPKREPYTMGRLKASMASEGFHPPIQLSQKEFNSGVWQEGKHRIIVAKALGYKGVPVEVDKESKNFGFPNIHGALSKLKFGEHVYGHTTYGLNNNPVYEKGWEPDVSKNFSLFKTQDEKLKDTLYQLAHNKRFVAQLEEELKQKNPQITVDAESKNYIFGLPGNQYYDAKVLDTRRQIITKKIIENDRVSKDKKPFVYIVDKETGENISGPYSDGRDAVSDINWFRSNIKEYGGSVRNLGLRNDTESKNDTRIFLSKHILKPKDEVIGGYTTEKSVLGYTEKNKPKRIYINEDTSTNISQLSDTLSHEEEHHEIAKAVGGGQKGIEATRGWDLVRDDFDYHHAVKIGEVINSKMKPENKIRELKRLDAHPTVIKQQQKILDAQKLKSDSNTKNFLTSGNPQVDEQMVGLYKQGVTAPEIAGVFGVDPIEVEEFVFNKKPQLQTDNWVRTATVIPLNANDMSKVWLSKGDGIVNPTGTEQDWSKVWAARGGQLGADLASKNKLTDEEIKNMTNEDIQKMIDTTKKDEYNDYKEYEDIVSKVSDKNEKVRLALVHQAEKLRRSKLEPDSIRGQSEFKEGVTKTLTSKPIGFVVTQTKPELQGKPIILNEYEAKKAAGEFESVIDNQIVLNGARQNLSKHLMGKSYYELTPQERSGINYLIRKQTKV